MFSRKAESKHSVIRTRIAELVADWADENGVDADISLSRTSELSFSFTDENGEGWEVQVSRDRGHDVPS